MQSMPLRGKQRIIAALIVIAAVVLPALGVWFYKGRHLSGYQPPNTEVTSDSAEISAHFETTTETLQKNGKDSATLVLDGAVPADLTAVSLQISFEPKLIKVTEVRTGNLWVSVNLLQNEIDNTGGVVKLAYGKSFEGGESLGTTVATVDFTFLGSQEDVALVSLGSESVATFVGEEAPRAIFAPALFLNSKGNVPVDFVPE